MPPPHHHARLAAYRSLEITDSSRLKSQSLSFMAKTKSVRSCSLWRDWIPETLAHIMLCNCWTISTLKVLTASTSVWCLSFWDRM